MIIFYVKYTGNRNRTNGEPRVIISQTMFKNNVNDKQPEVAVEGIHLAMSSMLHGIAQTIAAV